MGLASALTRTCKECKGTMALGLKSRLREHALPQHPKQTSYRTCVPPWPFCFVSVSVCRLKQVPKMTKKNPIKDGTAH